LMLNARMRRRCLLYSDARRSSVLPTVRVGQLLNWCLRLACLICSDGRGATRELILRYAAGAGNASRAIYINGAGASTNLMFPSTTAWSNYNTISVSYDFPPGPSTISLIFNSSTGSSNWLNLDNLTIPPPGPLTVAVHGESALISWSGPGLLQSAPDVSGPWSDLTNSPTSPLMIPSTEMDARRHQFYRLRQ